MAAQRWSWRQWLCERFGIALPAPRRQPHRRQRGPMLRVERLEQRELFTANPIVVSSLSDATAVDAVVAPTTSSGSITLRSAIEYLDAATPVGNWTIDFAGDLSGGTISLNVANGPLSLTDPNGTLTISGSTITVDGLGGGVGTFLRAASMTREQADAAIEAMLNADSPEAILYIGAFVEAGGLDTLDQPPDDDPLPVDPESVKRIDAFLAQRRKEELRAIADKRFGKKS